MKNNNIKGFSFVELIVVVTIIALLTVAGVVSFAGTNVKARDGRRKSDIEKIRMALEMARQIGSTYPENKTDLEGQGKYIQEWPKGPKKDEYIYTRKSPYTYDLFAYMEDVGSTNGNFNTVNCYESKCNYVTTNP